MKKIVYSLIAALITVATILSITACEKVEGTGKNIREIVLGIGGNGQLPMDSDYPNYTELWNKTNDLVLKSAGKVSKSYSVRTDLEPEDIDSEECKKFNDQVINNHRKDIDAAKKEVAALVAKLKSEVEATKAKLTDKEKEKSATIYPSVFVAYMNGFKTNMLYEYSDPDWEIVVNEAK